MCQFNKIRRAAAFLLVAACIASCAPSASAEEEEKSYIKYVEFNPTLPVLQQAWEYAESSHGEEVELDFITLLAYAAACRGGNFSKSRAPEIDSLAERLRAGEKLDDLTADLKYWNYYIKAYTAVLSGIAGEYSMAVPDETAPGGQRIETGWGLLRYSPIARGFDFSHYEDFGSARSFGYKRVHLGNDLMGAIGAPVVAVEGGIVEALGWNRYGGWRIGIRSLDGQRYYYYAHLRKNHPYNRALDVGSVVNAGDVIGYLGMTGYSDKEGVNNIKVPHLHFGLQLIFDESQKDGVNQIWIDVYSLVEFLQKNRSAVYKNEDTGEWERVNQPGNKSRMVSEDDSVALPIIMYHSLLYDNKRQGKYELSPDVLESDMKYLSEHGYHTVTPSDLAAYVDGANLPEKPVMLTFDDGYLNNCKYLPPLLEKYGMRALLSPVGAFADRYEENSERSLYYAMANWEDLESIYDTGLVELGNHTYNMHSSGGRSGAVRMSGETSEAYLNALRNDLSEMQNALYDHCSVRPIAFVYPFGAIGKGSEDVLRELGFRMSFTCTEKVSVISRDPESLWLLGRYNRSAGISTKSFMAKILS